MAPSSERLFDSLGHFGRFQACVYFASVFQAMSCGIHYLASVFMAVTPNFVCGFPGNVSSILFHNSSASSIQDIWTLWTSADNYIVVQLENGEIWELDQCSRSKRKVSLDLAYEYKGNKSVFSCSDGFLYDDTKWKNTVVTQWDLVCDREWLAKLIQPTFMLGVLIGAVIFGDIADRLGRQRVIWFTSAGQFVFGIAVAFTFDYYSFVVVRFLLAMDFNILIILANMAGKFSIGVAFGLIYLYTAELYPTIVRSLAVGSGSMMCRVGSVVAPFCVYLRSVWIFMPLVHFSLLCLCILEMAAPRVAVVGAGVIGLSTALCIVETCPSSSVTVLSDQFSPNTTSDVAAGMLIPHTYPGTPIHVQKQWFKETFTYLFAISNSAEASEAGIHLVSGWQVFKSTPKEELPFWSDVVLGFRPMSEAELQKFPQHRFGQAFTTLKCDCPPYLLWLEKRLKATGVQMYNRKVADLWELHSEYDIVVNCTGIGAHQLVGDKKLFPVRGQVLQVHAPWVKHFIRDGDGLTYIYPGINRVTLGGTREKKSWSLLPDPGTTKDIFDRCCSLEASLQKAQDVKVKVGLRPSRQCVRLQREVLSQGELKLPVVHNYGHGAGGFSVHRGTAKEAAHLVGECIAALRGSSLRAKL
ncbi:D-aspartate oxidase-like isoform X3 [Willisornis vidua]|uniref:D-aspartate oxidase n=1 Tax=Willisornis vidua TaxID=1566151 RepID=A0ABQ9DBD3_9PASS|nr:D-aspartate oxidase-like isoform X3 [Willisornis vidua]